jgi:hypothetical protein
MAYRLLADAVLLLHLGFILFVLLGALLVAWRRPLLPLHLAAAAWGIWIELSGAICPLTWVENRFRQLAGETGYGGGFVEHYLVPLIYPEGLGRGTQYVLAALVFAINLGLYLRIARRRSRTLASRPHQ